MLGLSPVLSIILFLPVFTCILTALVKRGSFPPDGLPFSVNFLILQTCPRRQPWCCLTSFKDSNLQMLSMMWVFQPWVQNPCERFWIQVKKWKRYVVYSVEKKLMVKETCVAFLKFQMNATSMGNADFHKGFCTFGLGLICLQDNLANNYIYLNSHWHVLHVCLFKQQVSWMVVHFHELEHQPAVIDLIWDSEISIYTRPHHNIDIKIMP